MKGAGACITSLPPEIFMLIVDRLLPGPGERQKRVDAANFACLRLACSRVRELCDASLRRLDLHDRNTAEMRHLLRRFTGAEVLALRPSCNFGVMQLGTLQHLTVLRSLQLPFSGNALSFSGLSALTQLTSFATDYAGNVQRALLYDQLRHLTGLQELDAPMVLQTEGLTVLTALSRLSRLVLEGDGFGVAELAMQLPALERLDLVLTLAGDMPDPEMAQVLGRLPQLAGLSEFALQAGPMQGLLRNLRLPQGIKATTFLQIGTAAATESGEDVAHLLALLPGLRSVGIGGEWAASPDAWAQIVPTLSVCQDLRFSGPLGEEAGKQLKPLGPQLTALSLQGASASSATVGAAKVLFAALQQCRDLDLKGCIHLDGRVFASLAATASTLTALNCEDMGTVTDEHLAALTALSRLSSLRLVRGKKGTASVNITPAGVASLGALTGLRNLKFDLARGHELTDEQLVQLSELRLTSLSLPPLNPAAGCGLASLHGSNTSLRELSIRGRATSELLMPSLVGFVNLTSLRLRPQLSEWGLYYPLNRSAFQPGWQLRSMVPAGSDATGCRMLRRLALASIDVDDDNLADGLAHMPHLQDLHLLNIELVTGAFLGSAAPMLMRLTLDHLLRFQTVSLLHLRRLTALTELRLRNTYAAAGEAAVCLLAPMLPPDLVTLDLTVDRAFHQGAEPMSRLTDQGLAVLTSPDLGPCRVKHLVLEGQRNVTGTGVRALTAGRFPDLEELVLDDTQVDDDGLAALAPLAPTLEFVSARTLQLSETWVTQAGVDAALAAFAERGGAPEIRACTRA